MAEAVLRLRRLREFSQEDLAGRLGTRQPAVARIERGDANMKLATLVRLAEALGATVRIDLEPVELLAHSPRPRRWWEREDAGAPLTAPQYGGVPFGEAPGTIHNHFYLQPNYLTVVMLPVSTTDATGPGPTAVVVSERRQPLAGLAVP